MIAAPDEGNNDGDLFSVVQLKESSVTELLYDLFDNETPLPSRIGTQGPITTSSKDLSHWI